MAETRPHCARCSISSISALPYRPPVAFRRHLTRGANCSHPTSLSPGPDVARTRRRAVAKQRPEARYWHFAARAQQPTARCLAEQKTCLRVQRRRSTSSHASSSDRADKGQCNATRRPPTCPRQRHSWSVLGRPGVALGSRLVPGGYCNVAIHTQKDSGRSCP